MTKISNQYYTPSSYGNDFKKGHQEILHDKQVFWG